MPKDSCVAVQPHHCAREHHQQRGCECDGQHDWQHPAVIGAIQLQPLVVVMMIEQQDRTGERGRAVAAHSGNSSLGVVGQRCM